MTHEDPLDDRLLQSVLELAERHILQADDAHLPDETLALFIAGGLAGAERDQVIAHLGDCPACRSAASLLMKLEAEAPASISILTRDSTWRRPAPWVLALAASVLAAATIYLLSAGNGNALAKAESEAYATARAQLERGDFDEARKTWAAASEQGVRSDRLLSLKAQVQRKIPSAIALAARGRLTDFGYELGGVAVRGADREQSLAAAQARKTLDQAGSTDLEAVLNHGHALLSMGRSEEALARFQQAQRLSPGAPLGWLGEGIAHFMRNDFNRAERAFRETLQRDSTSVPASINLAMTLEELGRAQEAKEIWLDLGSRPLDDADRRLIDAALNPKAETP